MRLLLSALALSVAPVMAGAHPHVFIDAGVRLIYDDQGRISAVRMGWTYDDLYSLLVVEDMGLDPDGDGVLSTDERGALAGFDGDWEPDFPGDLYLLIGDQPVALERPEDFTADYADGRITSTHLRRLSQPVPGETPLIVQVYDPSYYADYTILPQAGIEGRGDCVAVVYEPDPDAASQAYQQALAGAVEENPGTPEGEILVIDIGSAGADEVRVQCGPAVVAEGQDA